MNVFFTGPARRDLVEIGEYISCENPERAATFVAELVASCNRLSQLARAFALVPQLARQGIRKHRHGRNLIFYRIRAHPDSVEILRVVHGARDYMRLLLPDDSN